MARKLARIARIDAITAIKKADAIECAHIGGWPVVIKKGEHQVGDIVVYLEIDTFLPEGNPAWQFLVDKLPIEFNGVRGHNLHSQTMRGQPSQGLVLPLSVLGPCPSVEIGQDVTEALGVYKYEPPLPADLLDKAIGYRPSTIPGTDEERVQNLSDSLAEWRAESTTLTWEESEKLEGNSCSWALIYDEFSVCSRQVMYRKSEDVPQWAAAIRYDIEAKLRARFAGRNIVLQGEVVGPGIEGNIYGLQEHDFYLFRVYDVDTGIWLPPAERRALAAELGIKHVPIINEAFVLPAESTVEELMKLLLEMADGPSVVNPQKRREGIVFNTVIDGRKVSFKVVSNKYLLNVKL
jgi:RNA ligase (TIGR02306 family)